MKRYAAIRWLACLVIAGTSGGVYAQNTAASAQSNSQPTLAVGATNTAVLRAGTSIPLRTLDQLDSKESRVGQRFNLEVTDDVRLDGHVIFAAGTRAVGEVTKVVGKGMFGKSGKIGTRLLFIRAGEREIRITGQVGDAGAGGTAATVGAMVVIPVAGFFVTGKSASLAPGTQATAYLESDLPIAFAEAGNGPAPLKIAK